MARLFISYARKDGKPLMERLVPDLEREGHQPWVDRAEIRAGSGWAQTIEQEIDGCDALLAVLTQGSYDSDICRGEQSRALRKDRLVIPLLAQPDADRPIYLETRHYIDFTGDNYPAGREELLRNIREGRGVRRGQLSARDLQVVDAGGELPQRPLAAPADQLEWAAVVTATGQQTDRFLESASVAGQGGKVFDPRLFQERTAAARELDRFLAGPAAALLIVGDAGAGKTNLLCRWALDRRERGDAVLAHACRRLLSPEPGEFLAQTLDLDGSNALGESLRQIGQLAAAEDRLALFIFDGVNEFSGRRGEPPALLLRELDAAISEFGSESLRFIVSCSSATWNRLSRQDALSLQWSRYHEAASGDRFLRLGAFTEEEAEAMYAIYQRHLGLETEFGDLPAELRTRLREPLLLRLVAESQRGGALPTGALEVPVFGRYYQERVRRTRDQVFLAELATEMLRREQVAVPKQALAANDKLGPVLLDDAADSSYNTMLDAGLLTVEPGDLFVDDRIRFTHSPIGSYVLSRALAAEPGDVGATVEDLIGRADRFEPAWDAAIMLSAARGDQATDERLAGALDPELREAASAALVRLHAFDAEAAGRRMRALLAADSRESQRAALKAAYEIGPSTRELFLEAATSSSRSLRQAAKDTLYLIWRGSSAGRSEESLAYLIWRDDPEFTYGLLGDLLDRLGVRQLTSLPRILRFVMGLSITIYISHCDSEAVKNETARLYRHMAVDRLHLDRLSLGGPIEAVMLKAISSVFARRILQWILMSEVDAAERFFDLPLSERGRLVTVADLLDPAAAIDGHQDLLAELLESGVPPYQGAAALALAVHSCGDFAAQADRHRELFARLGPEGRVWQLLSFAVLLEETPEAWVELLEELTARFVDEHPELASESAVPILRAYDGLLFVPLALAYGKRGRQMPLYERWLEAGEALGPRLVSGLGVAGFYHPDAALGVLRPVLGRWREPEYAEALLGALATMRTLSTDRVDSALIEAGGDEGFSRRVAAATHVDLIQHYIYLLGFFNNSVHQCLYYPRMRRSLAAGLLRLLGEAEGPRQLIAEYAGTAMRMFREADFDLLQWTQPE